MAAGARLSLTTTKHAYVLYDSVDTTTTPDSTRSTGQGTPRYQITVDGNPVKGGLKTSVSGNAAGYVSILKALKAFYETIRYYEKH